MQQSYKSLLTEILQDVNGVDDKTLKERVKYLIQKNYFKLAEQIGPSGLRTSVTLDFSSVGTTGVFIPSDVAGINRVRDEDADIEFILRDSSEIEPDETSFRAYTYNPSQDPLFFYDDLTIANGSKTFLSSKLDAYITAGGTVVDEWMRVADEFGYYKITTDVSPYTLDRYYYGPDQGEAEFVVRPPESRKLVILSTDDSVLQDRDVVLYYWTYPRPLYNDSDVIMLPDTQVLKLKVIREMPEAKSRRPVSENEIRKAKAVAVKMNPQAPRSQDPRDKHNKLFTFNSNLFTNRD